MCSLVTNADMDGGYFSWRRINRQMRLPNYGIWDLLIKKAGHFIAYAILAVFVFRGTMEWKRPYLWAFLITAVYAMSDEFHQQFCGGATCIFV